MGVFRQFHTRSSLSVLFAAFCCALLVGAACGGGSTKKKKKKKKKDGQKSSGKKDPAPAGDDVDPRDQPKATPELQELVRGLGALDEKHWGAAEQKLKDMGEAAIPGLSWGLQFPLQNIRARSCNILSTMQKSNKMVPGCINALKQFPKETVLYEAMIRRWAAKTLADLYSVYLEENYRRSLEIDKDPGVQVFCGLGLCRLGWENGLPAIIKGLASEDDAIAGYAADAFAEAVPKAGLKVDAFKEMSAADRKAEAEKMKAWYESNKGNIKVVRGPKNFDPWPVNVKVHKWEPSTEPLDPEFERERDLFYRDGEQAEAAGDYRKATKCYAQSFRYGDRRDLKIALKQHECQRKIGPDFADKSYQYLMEKLIPRSPLRVELYIAAAKSGLASGGGQGKDMAKTALRMALMLDPENGEAKELMQQAGG